MIRAQTILKDNMLKGYDKDFNSNHFFFKHNCFLKDYKIDNFMPGNVINSVCAQYDINQRMIMVTLQREQGLISKKSIDEVKEYTRPNGEKIYPLDWACGCGVPDKIESIKKYKGFINQIKGAAATYRFWFDSFKPEQQIEILDKDTKACIPESAMTLALLKYTPHLDVIGFNERLFLQFFPELFK